MPGARRQRVSNQFDELDSSTTHHFEAVDGNYNPASEATDLFEHTGPSGRRALNDLAESDQDAADALLQMDDAATQRRFTEAYESDSVDSDEFATAVKRYDGLDADEKAIVQRSMARSDTDAIRLMRTDVTAPAMGS
ncbi:hypothetical protein [Haloarcula hispanica]|uniref:hypothetical protein n=1 Tax=Haloarcula hispanica TaxID=51589 RepID=UPI0011B72E63|nr:hypothetical protein [Haloarcula hispanica]